MNWIVLKSLYDIYTTNRTKKKQNLISDPIIQHLLNSTFELKDDGDEIVEGYGFKEYYEREHLQNFRKYETFLQKNGFLKPQTRFEENDINILIDIEARMQNGDLLEIRDQMIEAEETVRGVSHMFFKNEKYLEQKTSLVEAVKQLLGIKVLANEKDYQYMYMLKCKAPKAIVLCENLDFLKRSSRPRKNHIELWYAGGWNINKLEHIDTPEIPIYYSGDWDFDGLSIFIAVKEKLPNIMLLNPNGIPKSIKETDHESLWLYPSNAEKLSGLNSDIFDEDQIKIIKHLIQNNLWIIEESNDLFKMLGF